MSNIDIGTIFNRVTTQIVLIVLKKLLIPLLAIVSIATPLSVT